MTEHIEPSQRARNAAADSYVAGHPKLEETALMHSIRSGGLDRNSRVQAFARFERELSTNKDETIRKLREALLNAKYALSTPEVSDSPVVGEDCTCQRHPTHCANDCPQHGLSEPTYTAGERVDIPPTPTDTADRREAVARAVDTALAVFPDGMKNPEMTDGVSNLAWLTADAILSLIAGPLPEGFVVAPVEPTEAMCISAAERANIPLTPKGAREFYIAMIAARPTGEQEPDRIGFYSAGDGE